MGRSTSVEELKRDIENVKQDLASGRYDKQKLMVKIKLFTDHDNDARSMLTKFIFTWNEKSNTYTLTRVTEGIGSLKEIDDPEAQEMIGSVLTEEELLDFANDTSMIIYCYLE